MISLYNNYVLDATISSGSENPDYKWSTALLDKRLTRYGKFLSITIETLTFDLGSAKGVDYAYISTNNLTSSATVTLEGHTSDVWTSPAFSQTLTRLTDGNWIVALSSTETYQYWRLKFEDPTNPDIAIQISYIFIGDKLVMPGLSPDMIIPKSSNASVTKSPSGQSFADERVRLKSGRVTFPMMTDTQKNEVDTMFDTIDLVRAFVVIFFENDLDVEVPLYCALTTSPEFARNPINGVTWTVGFEFEEEK
jgi:hypothetical protein